MNTRQLELRDSTFAPGVGVFACVDFPPGVVVDEADVVLHKLGGTVPSFSRFEFNWSDVLGQGSDRLYQGAIALGFGSYYNHSDDANLRYFASGDRAMGFQARRAIHAGEELTINYRFPDGLGAAADWFARRGIAQRGTVIPSP